MGKSLGWAGLVVVFLAGLFVGGTWGRGATVSPSIYEGKPAKEAAAALLAAAEGQAGGGTWELIGVGRVYYLSGDKTKGQGFFDRVLSGKPKTDDLERIAKVYAEAGDWSKAEPLFRRVVEADPKDDGAQAELGAYYNLNGNRSAAEELFRRSFEKKPGDVWNTLSAAGSYVGVKPQ